MVATMVTPTIVLPAPPTPTKLVQYSKDLYTYINALISEGELDAKEATLITTRTDAGSELVAMVLSGSVDSAKLYQRLSYGFQPFARWLNGWMFNVDGVGCVFGIFEFDPTAEWQEEGEDDQ